MRYAETNYHQQRCHDVVLQVLHGTKFKKKGVPKEQLRSRLVKVKTYMVINDELEICGLNVSADMGNRPF